MSLKYLSLLLLLAFAGVLSMDNPKTSPYFVLRPTWRETLRMSMETVNAHAPRPTPAAYTSPYTSSSRDDVFTIDIDITGWTDLWLVNDHDNVNWRDYQQQPKFAQWHGVWANARILDDRGNVIKYADDGFCTAYDHESVSCWVDGYGKDNRDKISIGNRRYDKGLIFQGNSAWHVVLPPGNRHRRFRAEVGRWSGQNEMQLRFRVVQRADHKLWLREMWARTVMAFPDKLEEIEEDRNTGAWEDQWSSISGLAVNYARRTSTWNGYQQLALQKATAARTEQQLQEVVGLYYASRIRNKFFFLNRGVSLDWFSNVDEKISETNKMRLVYGDQYKNYVRDHNHLAKIKSNLDFVNRRPSASTDGWAVKKAGEDIYHGVYNYTMMWPPWLYDDVEPPAKRTVVVSTTQQYKNALANAREGDKIVVKPGIYRDVGHLMPVSFPSRVGESNVYPLMIVAEKPGMSHFTGQCTIETRGATNIIMRGFVIRDCDSRFQFTRMSRQIRLTDVTFMGTKDSININRNTASVRIDHTYMGCGTERVIRRLHAEDGGVLGFGRNQFDHMYLGQRRRSFQNGGELLRNIEPVSFYNNFIDKYVGEDAEIAKCGPGCKLINNTISRGQKHGQFPGRCSDGGVIEGNYFLSGNRIRTGGYDKKIVANNYVEGSYVLIGSSSWPVAFFNNVNFTRNTFYGGTLGINSQKTDPRHQFKTHMEDNLFLNTKMNNQATDQNTWTGSGNIASPSIPSGLPHSLWKADSSLIRDGICIDEYGIARPIKATKAGFQRRDPPFTAFDTRVGPKYLPVSVRLNRFLVSEYNFDKTLFTSSTPSSHVFSDWGAFEWNLDMYSFGGVQRADLYSPARTGVSGTSSDFALDTRINTMGSVGGVVKGVVSNPQNLHGFTISGWFNANKGSPLQNNAVLVSSRGTTDESRFAYEIKAGSQPGRLAVSVNMGGRYYTWESPSVYTNRNEWTFFAVVYEPSEPYINFYKGSSREAVRSVHRASAVKGEIPLRNHPQLTIGASSSGARAFAGLIDNIRLWYSESGPNRYDEPSDRHAELLLDELEFLRRSDLKQFAPSDPTKK